ncbi:MAG: hypothetical protein HZA28_01380 [Candidatus Omnitrophica bacterium]|nr:hypothetical protein [Candidatus Omnitrophota bacterium]
MMPHQDGTFVLRENNEWLRYVFWGAAIGMGFLVVSAVNSPVRDVVKIIGSVMGVFLFGFSGFVFQTHKTIVDPSRREITITSKGFKKSTSEIVKFDSIDRIIVITTFAYDEDLMPANRWQECWSLALACKERSVPITHNLYVSKEQAVRDAKKIRQILNVEISDTVEESIASLAQNGRKIEAVTLASRALGMTTTRAKDFVDKNTGLTSRSSGIP